MRWKDGKLVPVPDGEVDITSEDVQFPLADLPIIVWALELAAETTRLGDTENCNDCLVTWHNHRKDCPVHIWHTVYQDLRDRIQREMETIADYAHPYERRSRDRDGSYTYIPPHPKHWDYAQLNTKLHAMFEAREEFGVHYQPDTKV
jgi:hypothetical protein